MSKDKKKKSGKKEKSGKGKNAFSKGYKPKPPKQLDGPYPIVIKGATDKKTKTGRAVVLAIAVEGEKIKFDHYINYESSASDTAMAMAHDAIKTLCKEADIEHDKDEFVDGIVGFEGYAQIKTSKTDNGYTNYSIKKFLKDSEIDD